MGAGADVRLMLGDCLERMAEIKDQSVDLVLCDLPYGTTACAWDSVIPFEPLWAHYWRVCRGAVVLTASQPFTSILVNSNLKNFQCEWIYEKNIGSNFGSIKTQPMKEHESVLIFKKSKITYNPIMEARTAKSKKNIGRVLRGSSSKEHHPTLLNAKHERRPITNMRCPRSIQRFEMNRHMPSLHPTQKPVALMEYMIRTYTNPGALVLDNCMGSGTTGVAALNCGRRFIGIERDAGYFAIAEKRIKETDAYQILCGED